jgi:cobyrinic acid a,c-diamide synthase
VTAPSRHVVNPRGLVIAGTHSGVGKTSLSLGVMGALIRRGHTVMPFKVGPDYIDPTYHSLVCGRPCRNLDTWLMPPSEAEDVFRRTVAAATGAPMVAGDPAAGGDSSPQGDLRPTGGAAPDRPALDPGASVAVVEGVMGLFDGMAGAGERCSTAEMAKLLGLPVVLIVDTAHMARSAAAVVHGFATFDPGLRVAGVILNKVGSPVHAAMLRDALAGGPPIVGVVPRQADLRLDSRHLGLIPTVEDPAIGEVLDRIIAHVEAHVDLDVLVELAQEAQPAASGPFRTTTGGETPEGADRIRRRRVAVARDSAFSFYYEDNLEVLEEEGADVVLFSPVAGDGLPECDALYLGGGYPEVYADELAANFVLRDDLRRAVADGLPVYAECGGYLYLGADIEYGPDRHAMAGVIPTHASLAEKRLRVGYVEAQPVAGHPLADRGGAPFHGHLFHYSTTTGSAAPAYRVTHKGESLLDGWAGGSVVASYVHLHFRGSRAVARWLAGTDDPPSASA